jgi:hypothetical protein
MSADTWYGRTTEDTDTTTIRVHFPGAPGNVEQCWPERVPPGSEVIVSVIYRSPYWSLLDEMEIDDAD